MFSACNFALHLAVVLSLLSSVVGYTDGNCTLCKVPKHYGHEEALKRLAPLCGLRFSTQDDTGEYTYNIGICVAGEVADTPFQTAGAIQTNLKQETHGKTIIGSLEKTEIMSGSNWISLEYEGGISYGSHCMSEERRTIIMITCNPSSTTGNLRWVEENRNKSGDCYYLFELEHSGVCSTGDNDGGLGPGSIVCIVLATVVGSYLLFGILFMRFVKGAKGLHQIPNFEFWQDFGNLQADGCDLICRCNKSRYAEAKPYHGIGDHQIESANDGENLDEHLLQM